MESNSLLQSPVAPDDLTVGQACVLVCTVGTLCSVCVYMWGNWYLVFVYLICVPSSPFVRLSEFVLSV